MPLANIIVPPYPDVPAAPGLPPVLRQAGAVINNVEMLTADVVAIVRMFQGPQWGIFDQNGQPVLIGDSVISVDYRKEYRISDYPIEEGAFASYNKVQDPFDVRIVFASTGKLSMLGSLLSGGAIGSLITGTDPNAANRKQFLEKTDTALGSLAMFTVVTPEVSYAAVNIIHYDYRREAKDGGATMLRVEVWCREVRAASRATSTGTDSIASPATPAGTPGGTTPAGTGDGGTGTGTGTGGSTVSPELGNTAQPDGTSPTIAGTVQSQPVPVTPEGVAPVPGGINYGGAVVDVRTIDGGVPPGQVPLYQNGAYVGHMVPGAYPLPAGFTAGPAAP